MKILAPKTDNEDVIDKQYVDTGLSGKQATLVSGTNIKTINNQSLLGSGNINISGGGDISIKTIDASDSTQWDAQEEQPTQASMQDIATNNYQILIIENLPIGEGISFNASFYLLIKLDYDDTHVRQYVRFDDGDEEDNEPTVIETRTFGNFDEENPTVYYLLSTSHKIIKNININGTSIVQNNSANIITNTEYNPTTNPIATISDLNNFEEKLKYDYNGESYYYQFYGVKSIDNITVNVGVEVDVVYATLLLINMDIETMKQAYSSTLPAILGIQIPSEDYITTTLTVVIHNLGIMTCTVDASTKYVTEAVFTNYAQGYSVNFGANPNELTVYYSALNSEDYLSKDNTTAYVPSTNYNPATKQYVDTTISNAISSAITNTLNTAV